ncbi:MAG TPA: Fic family protein, partial [Enorma massiliensis]
ENARRAYELIGSLDPLSLDDLLHAHRIIMNGLIEHTGCFRTGDVGVFSGDALIRAGTPARYVPQVMADLFGWLAGTNLQPLISSCIFHYEFEFIHPFSDGNDRTGRLWHTLLLARWRPDLAWLPVESVIRERQQRYYAALAASNSAGSSEFFVTFMLQVVRDALLPFVRPESAEETRTRQALAFFSEHPRGTVAGLAALLSCSKRSTERLVANLRGEGKLRREGSARGGVWIVEDTPAYVDLFRE